MHPNMRRAHDIAWRKFYKDETQLFYDCELKGPADYSSVEEVTTEIPGVNCRGRGLGDPCLDTGWRLDGLLLAHRLTGDKEWAEKATKLFHGLVRLAQVPQEKGFIPRGVYPGRTDFYPHSSRDQHTSFIYAMWNYCRSPLATAQDKTVATDLVLAVCRRLERNNHDIAASNGKCPAVFGALSGYCLGESDRLLMFYKAAYVMSGERHWQDLYLAKRYENNSRRLQTLGGAPGRLSWRQNIHGRFQTQMALQLLLTCEDDPDVRRVCRDVLAENAESVMTHIDLWHIFARPTYETEELPLEEVWRDYKEWHERHLYRCPPTAYLAVHTWYHYMRDQRRYEAVERARSVGRMYCPPMLPAFRHLVEATATVMMSEDEARMRDAGAKAWPFLVAADYDIALTNGTTCFLELAYWRGVERGIFPLA